MNTSSCVEQKGTIEEIKDGSCEGKSPVCILHVPLAMPKEPVLC